LFTHSLRVTLSLFLFHPVRDMLSLTGRLLRILDGALAGPPLEHDDTLVALLQQVPSALLLLCIEGCRLSVNSL
jgi:hypothetical protein